MSGYTAGQRVRITAPCWPGATGTVLDPHNDLLVLTVTVQVDATPYTPAHWTYFAPDEIEVIHDRTEDAAGDAGRARDTVSA